jgi:uncharacterized protein YdhG (YjbR/CyaY superfamily)
MERISYGMPTFFLNGNLVHYAAYRRHIGFYPGSEAIQVFASELEAYETSKGTVRFPIDQTLPMDLIIRIVRHRVEKNLGRTSTPVRRRGQIGHDRERKPSGTGKPSEDGPIP